MSQWEHAKTAAANRRCEAEYHVAEEQLIQTRQVDPIGIAYKLADAECGLGGKEDWRDPGTVIAIVTDEAESKDKRLIASAYMDLMTLAHEQANDTGRARWDELLAGFRTTYAEREALSAAQERAQAAVDAEAPVPPELQTRAGGSYNSERAVLDHCALSPEQRLHMIEVGRVWWPQLAAAQKRHDTEGLEERWDEVDDRLYGLLKEIVKAPAPDAAALAVKLHIMIERFHLDLAGMKADDPSTIGYLMSRPDRDVSGLAYLLVDALRISGSASPAVGAKPFDCEGFSAAFEAKAGFYIERSGAVFYEDEGGPIDQFDRAHWNAYRELKIWEKKQLREWGKARDERASEWWDDFQVFGDVLYVIAEDGHTRTLQFDVRYPDRPEPADLISTLEADPAIKRLIKRKARWVDNRPHAPQWDPDTVHLTPAGRAILDERLTGAFA